MPLESWVYHNYYIVCGLCKRLNTISTSSTSQHQKGMTWKKWRLWLLRNAVDVGPLWSRLVLLWIWSWGPGMRFRGIPVNLWVYKPKGPLFGKVNEYRGNLRVHELAGHGYHGSITKTGPTSLRWILVEACHSHLLHCKDKENCKLCQFYKRISHRRGKKIALVAMAAKMIRIIYWMLRLNQPYMSQGLKPTVGMPENGAQLKGFNSWARLRRQAILRRTSNRCLRCGHELVYGCIHERSLAGRSQTRPARSLSAMAK